MKQQMQRKKTCSGEGVYMGTNEGAVPSQQFELNHNTLSESE